VQLNESNQDEQPRAVKRVRLETETPKPPKVGQVVSCQPQGTIGVSFGKDGSIRVCPASAVKLTSSLSWDLRDHLIKSGDFVKINRPLCDLYSGYPINKDELWVVAYGRPGANDYSVISCLTGFQGRVPHSVLSLVDTPLPEEEWARLTPDAAVLEANRMYPNKQIDLLIPLCGERCQVLYRGAFGGVFVWFPLMKRTFCVRPECLVQS
jgi:hypothetical protein